MVHISFPMLKSETTERHEKDAQHRGPGNFSLIPEIHCIDLGVTLASASVFTPWVDAAKAIRLSGACDAQPRLMSQNQHII